MLRRGVQYVFQDPFASLDPRLTVGFSIAEPILTHRLLRRRSGGCPRAGRCCGRSACRPRCTALSARTLGRAAPARLHRPCARSDPRLIIADEAVAALDVSIRAQVVNLLMELQARLGIAYLFITHDMAVVEHIATASRSCISASSSRSGRARRC